MGEVWKPIPGFDGYDASDLGRVRSWRTNAGGSKRRAKPRLLQPRPTTHGYLNVIIVNNGGVRKNREVQCLVLEAHVGPRPGPDWDARHFPDPTTTNNALSNLSWATKRANMADKIAHGTRIAGDRHPRRTKPHCWPSECVPRGERHANAKMTDAIVAEVKTMLAQGLRQKDIAARLGLKFQAVSAIKLGKIWRHVA